MIISASHVSQCSLFNIHHHQSAIIHRLYGSKSILFYVSRRLWLCMPACLSTSIQERIWRVKLNVYIYIHMYLSVYVYIYIYTHTHICIYTYIHMILPPKKSCMVYAGKKVPFTVTQILSNLKVWIKMGSPNSQDSVEFEIFDVHPFWTIFFDPYRMGPPK